MSNRHTTPHMKTVLEGHEDFLFLAGGAHTPLLYARGEKKITDQSLRIFWNNHRWRQTTLGHRSIRHVHLIAPDKHSVCPEVFPEEIVVSVGRRFLQAAPTPELKSSVLYPVEDLSANFRRNCSKVDTHFTPHGTGILCLSILGALGEQELVTEFKHRLSTPETVLEPWTGDLGHRFKPPRTEPKVSLKMNGKIKRFSNNIKGNMGIIDLHVNPSARQKSLGRVMLFGDSYGRQIASMLSHLAEEIIFLRTPYLHIELVNTAKPDLVITQNAERYLPSSVTDGIRPNFFILPFLKDDATVNFSKQSALAISNFLRGRPSDEG
jgi:hypothetical protein